MINPLYVTSKYLLKTPIFQPKCLCLVYSTCMPEKLQNLKESFQPGLPAVTQQFTSDSGLLQTDAAMTSSLQPLHLNECMNKHKLAQKVFETYSNLPVPEFMNRITLGNNKCKKKEVNFSYMHMTPRILYIMSLL